MRLLTPEEHEAHNRATKARDELLTESANLFRLLAEKYQEYAVYNLVFQELEVSKEKLRECLFRRRGLSDGTVKRIYGLLKSVWENPKPTDFPISNRDGQVKPSPKSKCHANFRRSLTPEQAEEILARMQASGNIKKDSTGQQ